MNKAYSALNLSEEQINLLSDEEKVDAIIDAYYSIMFDLHSTTMDKDRAETAFRILLNPSERDYYVVKDDVKEGSHGIRR